MTDERRETAAGGAAVRPRALPEGAAPGTAETAGTGTAGAEAPAADQADPDPPDTTLADPALFDTDPADSDLTDIDAARAVPPLPGPPIGAAETRALIRTQLRTALGTGAFVMAVVTALPVLMALVPAVARARVHGVPLPWLVLAFGIQPVWVAVSLRQLARAERAERELARPAGRR